MKLLHIGDVVGAAGSRFLQERLPNIKRTHKIDMTVVNGENSAQGNGITKHSMEQIFSAGADVITTGNHCFKRREALAIYDNPVVLRPANYPEGCVGHGICTIDFGPCQVAVLNLSGTAYLDPLDNPFTVVEELLEEIETPNILVDFHAEATAEKKAMAISSPDGDGGSRYAYPCADGRRNDFVGTYGLYHRCGHDRTGGIYPGRCSTAGAGSVPVPFSYTVHRGQRSLLFERRYHYV